MTDNQKRKPEVRITNRFVQSIVVCIALRVILH